MPKRFTTQMYLYFLPLQQHDSAPTAAAATGMQSAISSHRDSIIPVPTHDGGLEHTAARFRSVHEWLDRARAGDMIVYPPQFFLMWKLSEFFARGTHDNTALQAQRDAVRAFVHTGHPPWTHKCICPMALLKLDVEHLQIVSLESPGPELHGSDRSGERQYLLAIPAGGNGITPVRVMERNDVFDEARRQKRAAQKGLKVAALPGWTKGTPRI